ncbi:aflatoxin regulatory protein-domain-containing protein [Pestalotiopsis sp. NC0098]|nr:aflatoxin regulatory protein-domain-containing protein [Pestalotiopsis sp. NC0098]
MSLFHLYSTSPEPAKDEATARDQISRRPSSSERSEGSTAPRPPAPKLRDSCEGCANSKLKCPKQKPTCFRCAKRGIPCVYVATRRGGRKSGSWARTKRTQKAVTGPSPPPTVAQTTPILTGEDLIEDLGGLDEWLQASQEDFMVDVTSAPSTEIISPLASAVDNWNHFDNYLAFSPKTLSLCDISGPMPASFGSVRNGESDLTTLFKGLPPFLEDAPADANLDTDATLSTITDTPQFRHAEPCGLCMELAFRLLKEISPATIPSSSGAGESDDAGPLQSILDIIATNKKTIDGVISILGCSCSDDGFLLSIVWMLVFRVLDWYAVAARMGTSATGSEQHSAAVSRLPSPQQTPPRSVANSTPSIDKDEDPKHIAAQRVLSELHHMQHLAKELSKKIEELPRNPGPANGASGPSLTGEKDSSKDRMYLSTNTWDRLGSELKQKLKSLSGDIISILRGE